MQIPFADALLSRLSRRGAGLELIEEIEDEAAESVDAADLPSAEPALLLQRMENRLIRHQLAAPEVLSDEELRKLRYILNFARLADFEPGAAGPGGSRGRGDVSVGAEIAPWRSRVADALYGPLREEPDPITALRTAREALASLEPDQDDQRRVLIVRHGNDFSPAELDSEVGYKKLVTVLGGGGGAGFVYIGGMLRLLEVGQVPDYMIGSSIGSILGSLVARALPVPIEEYIAWAKKGVLPRHPGTRTAAPPPRAGRHVRVALRSIRPRHAQPRGRPTNAHVGLGHSVRHRGRGCSQATVYGPAVPIPPSRISRPEVAVGSVSSDRHRPGGRRSDVASRRVH